MSKATAPIKLNPLLTSVKPKPVVKIQLTSLHPLQQAAYDDKSRFKVLACGRRWGKTRYAEVEAIEAALVRNERVWWVAPTFQAAMIAWRAIKTITQNFILVKNEAERYMFYPGGGEIWFKSAENYDNLRGESVNLAILDEAAYIHSVVWSKIIRPMLADCNGRGILLSTPKGTNYFYDLWARGQDGYDANWKSWSFPTSTNPYIPPDEIEEARSTTPDLEFREEWLAEFVGNGGSVFPNIDETCILIPNKSRTPGHIYVAGLDWGLSNDFTVLTVFDATTRKHVYTVRTNQIDYQAQYELIKAAHNIFSFSRIVAEDNSIGVPNAEALISAGLPIEVFQTTNESKAQIVRGLIYAMETERIQLLNDPVLINEFKKFQAKRTETGKWKYSAISGHDDIVMSVLLANSALTSLISYTPAKIMRVQPRGAIIRQYKEKINRIQGGGNY